MSNIASLFKLDKCYKVSVLRSPSVCATYRHKKGQHLRVGLFYIKTVNYLTLTTIFGCFSLTTELE